MLKKKTKCKGVSFLVRLQFIDRSISPSQVFFQHFTNLNYQNSFYIMPGKRLRNYQKFFKNIYFSGSLPLSDTTSSSASVRISSISSLSCKIAVNTSLILGDNFEFALHEVGTPLHNKEVVEHQRQKFQPLCRGSFD